MILFFPVAVTKTPRRLHWSSCWASKRLSMKLVRWFHTLFFTEARQISEKPPVQFQMLLISRKSKLEYWISKTYIEPRMNWAWPDDPLLHCLLPSCSTKYHARTRTAAGSANTAIYTSVSQILIHVRNIGSCWLRYKYRNRITLWYGTKSRRRYF